MALRESPIRTGRRRRRPIWGILAIVIAGMVVLFGIGFGISLLVRGSGTPEADAIASATAISSAAPLPCETTMITPAEVLPVTGKVIANVYNGTKRQGLARDTANTLTARGMKVKKVGNEPKGAVVEGVAEIRYGPKAKKAATLLTYYFPGATLVEIDRKGRVVDIVVGKKFEKVAGDAEIAAALASPSPSASGPGCIAPSADAPNANAPSALASAEPAAASAAPSGA